MSFLKYADYRWLKIASGFSALTILIYALIDVEPRHSGNSWYGYTLGTIGAILILWLALLGWRKRSIKPGQWTLKSWVSAHVWLGLSLIIVVTLHGAFQFGWNVHTLAYVLMMIVILSGIYGICAYTILPKQLSSNRGDMTQVEMLDNLRSIDRQLHDATQPLSTELATDNARPRPTSSSGCGSSRRCPAAHMMASAATMISTPSKPLEKYSALW